MKHTCPFLNIHILSIALPLSFLLEYFIILEDLFFIHIYCTHYSAKLIYNFHFILFFAHYYLFLVSRFLEGIIKKDAVVDLNGFNRSISIVTMTKTDSFLVLIFHVEGVSLMKRPFQQLLSYFY